MFLVVGLLLFFWPGGGGGCHGVGGAGGGSCLVDTGSSCSLLNSSAVQLWLPGPKKSPNNLILKTTFQIGTHSQDILAPMASRAEPSFGIETKNSDIIRSLKAPDMTINELQHYPIFKGSGHDHQRTPILSDI